MSVESFNTHMIIMADIVLGRKNKKAKSRNNVVPKTKQQLDKASRYAAKRLQKQIAEAEERRLELYEKKLQENRRRYPVFMRQMESEEFNTLYESIMGEPFPQEVLAEDRRVIEFHLKCARRQLEINELSEMERIRRIERLGGDDVTCSERRRIIMLLAKPKWADKDKIRAIYAKRDRLNIMAGDGEKYHVDHIIPLQGKWVCGLHCEDNLRVITAMENHRKHNRFEDVDSQYAA